MRWRKLWNMSVDELQDRIAQRALYKYDAWSLRLGRTIQWPLPSVGGGGRRVAPSPWQQTGRTPEAVLGHRFPRETEQVLQSANRMLAGKLDLLGYKGIAVSWPINWHWEPLAERHIPAVHWSRLNPLDFEQVGDHKLIWELGRCQWLLQLAFASCASGKEVYRRHFWDVLAHWHVHNPVGVGIHWASSLEVAYRAIAWIWGLWLLSCEPRPWLRESLMCHGRHIVRYPSTYSSPNTHLTGEALGLFYIGLYLGVPHWRDHARRMLERVVSEHVFDDGVYFEKSTWYQRYAAEIYLHYLLLSRVYNLVVSPSVRRRVARLVRSLADLQKPDGGLPQMGDDDGGRLLPLVPREPEDWSDVKTLAAMAYDDERFHSAAALTPEAWCLSGGDQLPRDRQASARDQQESSRDTQPSARGKQGSSHRTQLSARDQQESSRHTQPSARAHAPVLRSASGSACYQQGGYAILRSGSGARAHQLVFRAGGFGRPVGGHAHADLLSIQCNSFGESHLVDPGTFTYVHRPWRDALRSTAQHNTVVVDGAPQSQPNGPFGWRTLPDAKLTQWQSNEHTEIVAAEHSAYAGRTRKLSHRRRVVFVKPYYWVVVDDLDGGGEHDVELSFQFDSQARVTPHGAGWVRSRRMHALLLHTMVPPSFERRFTTGQCAPPAGWVSHCYGQLQEATLVRHRGKARLPLRVATLLLPVWEAGGAPPGVQWLLDRRGWVEGLMLDGGFPGVRVSSSGATLLKNTAA